MTVTKHDDAHHLGRHLTLIVKAAEQDMMMLMSDPACPLHRNVGYISSAGFVLLVLLGQSKLMLQLGHHRILLYRIL